MNYGNSDKVHTTCLRFSEDEKREVDYLIHGTRKHRNDGWREAPRKYRQSDMRESVMRRIAMDAKEFHEKMGISKEFREWRRHKYSKFADARPNINTVDPFITLAFMLKRPEMFFD